MEISILFIFLSFLFSNMCNSKTIQCMGILYIPNDFSATGHIPFWLGVAYELGLASYSLETASKDASRSHLLTSKASFTHSGCDMYSQEATPRLLNACDKHVSLAV